MHIAANAGDIEYIRKMLVLGAQVIFPPAAVHCSWRLCLPVTVDTANVAPLPPSFISEHRSIP